VHIHAGQKMKVKNKSSIGAPHGRCQTYAEGVKRMRSSLRWILILTLAAGSGLAILPGCTPSINNSAVSLTVSSIGSGGGTSVSYIAPLNFLFQNVTVEEGVDFLSTNICQGETIFGLSGTAACNNQILDSMLFRNAGSSQLTQSQVVTTYAGSGSSPALPSN
jgi:hypothetical protein